MLSFTAENVRSYSGEVHLSLLGTRLASPGVVRDLEIGGSLTPVKVLPVAGVFGANASGKSTLLRAMADMRDVVLNSFRRGDSEARIERYPVPSRGHRRASIPLRRRTGAPWRTLAVRLRNRRLPRLGRVCLPLSERTAGSRVPSRPSHRSDRFWSSVPLIGTDAGSADAEQCALVVGRWSCGRQADRPSVRLVSQKSRTHGVVQSRPAHCGDRQPHSIFRNPQPSPYSPQGSGSRHLGR